MGSFLLQLHFSRSLYYVANATNHLYTYQALMPSWGSRSEYSPNAGDLPVCGALSFATGAKMVRKWAVDLVTLPLGELWEESRM